MRKTRRSFLRSLGSGNSLYIFGIVLTAVFFSVLSVAEINGQKKKTATINKKSEVIRPAPLPSNRAVPEPPSKYAFIIEIDKNERIAVKVENVDGTPFKGSSAVSLLSEFFTQIGSQDPEKILTFDVDNDPILDAGGIDDDAPVSNKKSSANKQTVQKLSFADVIIKPHAETSFDTIIRIANAARNSTMRVKIEIPDFAGDPYLIVPRMILADRKYNPIIKPNPNTLIVFLAKNGSLRLNMEEQGSMNDLSALTQMLRRIFEDREARGILRENSAEVEATVSIKAPRSTRFIDISRLAKALKEAGASPVGLLTDDLEQ